MHVSPYDMTVWGKAQGRFTLILCFSFGFRERKKRVWISVLSRSSNLWGIKFVLSKKVPQLYCIFPFSFLCDENEASVRKWFGAEPCWTRYLDSWVMSALWIVIADVTSDDPAHYVVLKTWFEKTQPSLSGHAVQRGPRTCQTPPVGSRKRQRVCLSACQSAWPYICVCVGVGGRMDGARKDLNTFQQITLFHSVSNSCFTF